MARTKIEWCDFTFNPWRGCSKVSEGCRNCYADTLSHRNPKTLGVWGPNGTRVVAAESMWREPLKWDLAAEAALEQWRADSYGTPFNPPYPKPERPRVFCASLADVFEDWQGPMVDASGERLMLTLEGKFATDPNDNYPKPATMQDVRRRLFELIDATPNLDWLLLTKRPENIRSTAGMRPPVLKSGVIRSMYKGLSVIRNNVWLGTSVENQQTADERIPHLLRVPAAVRFLSMEPLLGPVDIDRAVLKGQAAGLKSTGIPSHLAEQVAGTFKPLDGIHWVIVGGESGPGARPMHPGWARSIRDQCQAAGVAFFMKQMGGVRNKGGELSEIPEDLRIREFPKGGES